VIDTFSVKKAASLLAVAGVAVFGLAACGSSSDSSSSDSSSTASGTASGASSTTAATDQTVTISTDPSGKLAFTTDHVDAKAGPTTIELDNPSTTSHKLEVKGADGAEIGSVDPISQSKGSFNADLKPGEYTFVCDLPGHEATMHGTITVK
jgi:plastocyanin